MQPNRMKEQHNKRLLIRKGIEAGSCFDHKSYSFKKGGEK